MAFLRVADSMEENDLELKVWVKQVRDAAYDTEDVLDKFKLNFAHNHGTGFHGFVRKISFSIKTLKARYQIAYEPLSPQESWTLLCKKTFQENNCPSHLEGLLTSILRRYEGWPLAIVAISGLLSVKDQNSVAEWEKTYRSLGAELEGNNRLLGMKKILSLSYIDLPHYLKLCFLYLSVFPEDHLIEHWRLIWLWIAEGFVEVKEGAPIEQVAEGYLNELVNRSLIQAGGFQKLKILMLIRLKGLRRVIVEEGAMPHLEELYIQNCKLMAELPSCIEQLTNLTLLDLFDMSDILVSKLNRGLQGGDYWRIAHIPEVWIGDTKDGRWRGTNM
ncbi:hypothetical protein ACSBR1_038038 [Camellia fascicularis]